MAAAIALHILSAIIWVGGMFFAYVCLRPVAAQVLEPPQRLTLWRNVFQVFFKFVFASIALLLASGHFMILQYGGMKIVGIHVHIMLLLGYIMTAIFLYVFFSPYKGLSQAVNESNWPQGAQHLNRIRQMVGLNLLIGLITALVASAGRFI